MDNKITKQRINSHLEYDWFKYILLLIVGAFLCYFVFQQINADRDFETIDIFATAYSSYSNTFSSDVTTELLVGGDDIVRQLNLEVQNPTDNTYGTLLQTHGMVADLLILGESTMLGGYLPWTDELIDTTLTLPDGTSVGPLLPASMRDTAEYYIYRDEETGEEYRLGLRVDNLPGIKRIFNFDPGVEDTEDKTYDRAFFLAINRDSVNIGTFGRKEKNHGYTHALFCINRFLTYYG